MSAAPTIGHASAATPFKFLSYYEEKDAETLGGRDSEVAEIANAIVHAATLVVYGKSGLGKTSLFLAGVFPELRRRGYLPIHVRTLKHPIADVLYAITQGVEASEPAPREAPELATVVEALHALAREQPIVVVLDQFEEFFIRFRDDRSAYGKFIQTIGAIANDDSLQVHVVFSLREEYLADLDDFRGQLPTLFENEYRLHPMSAFGVRQAIVRPLEVADIACDPRLISRLVDRLARERFDSVVLQILCREVFEKASRRQGALQLLEEDLQSAGEVEVVFRRYLDEAAAALPEAQHLQARVVLRLLTTQERTKQALRIGDFTKFLYHLEESEALTVLEVLERHHLLRADQRGGETWYELTHERLVPILEPWLRLDQQFNALLAAYDWIATPTRSEVWRSDPKNLLPAGLLTDVVGPFRTRLALGPQEIEFLTWSSLYHRHPDVEFWGLQLGLERATALVRVKLSDPAAQFRSGAAFAAARLAHGDAHTLQRLFELTQNDPVEDVRREAGAALARIGTEGVATQLQQALREARSRRAALQTLADWQAAGKALPGFSRWDRLRASRIVRARTLTSKRLVIGDASRAGAVGGLVGGVAWTLSVVLLYGTLLSCVVAGTSSTGFWPALFLCLGVALLGAIVLGGLLCVFVSRSVASHFVLRESDNVLSALRRSKAFWTIPAIVSAAVLLFCALVALGGGNFEWGAPLFGALGLLLWSLVPLGARLAQLATDRRDGPLARLRAALLAAAGLPLLVPCLLQASAFRLYEARAWSRSAMELLAAMSLLAIPVISGLTASVAAALLRMTEQQHADGLYPAELPLFDAPRRSRARSAWRWLLRSLPVAALGLMLARLTLDVVPLLAPELVLHGVGSVVRLPAAGTTDRPLWPLSEVPRYSRLVLFSDNSVVRVGLESESNPDQAPESGATCGQIRIESDLLPPKARIVLNRASYFVALTPQLLASSSCDARHTLDVVASVAAGGRTAAARPGDYLWLDFEPTPNRDRRGPDARLPIESSRFEAQVSGLQGRPNQLLSIELYTTLEVEHGPDTDALLMCSPSTSSPSEVRSHARHELGPAMSDFMLPRVCLVRADEQGKWSVRLGLRATERVLGSKRNYRGLVQVKAGLTVGRVDGSAQDLSAIALKRARLMQADLSRANLTRASFVEADLQKAQLSFATLTYADLKRANLAGAELEFADLSHATLAGANLSGASFFQTNLSGADLTGAYGYIKNPGYFETTGICGTEINGLPNGLVVPACREDLRDELRARPASENPRRGMCSSAPVAKPAYAESECETPLAEANLDGDLLRWKHKGVDCRCVYDPKFRGFFEAAP